MNIVVKPRHSSPADFPISFVDMLLAMDDLHAGLY